MQELTMTVYQIQYPKNINQFIKNLRTKSKLYDWNSKARNIKGTRAGNDGLSNPRSHQRKDFASLPAGALDIHINDVISAWKFIQILLFFGKLPIDIDINEIVSAWKLILILLLGN